MRHSLVHSLLVPVLIVPALLLATAAHAGQQTRPAGAFDAINARGALNIVVEAGKTASVVVSGSDAFIRNLKTDVSGGELRITLEDNNSNTIHGSDNAKVTITLPALRQFKIAGAGESVLHNIKGDKLTIVYQGAGSLTADGDIKQLNLTVQGVGEIDTKALHAQQVDVKSSGVGHVSVFASERLDAKVKGMGELEYYGKPRSVSKSAQGMGSISAAN